MIEPMKRWVERTLPYIPLVAIILVMAGRFHLGLIRMFDPDEFSHIHWSYLVFAGKRPYVDFFFYIVPTFQWMLAPFFLLPHTPFLVILFRIVAFLLYGATALVLYRIARLAVKNTFWSMLAVLAYTVFPMTLDKTIDVRPDTLMMLLFLVSVFLLVDRKPLTAKRAFICGMSLSLSFLTMSKMVFAIPAVMYLLFAERRRITRTAFLWGVAGVFAPPLVFVLYLFVTGIGLVRAATALTQWAFAVNLGKEPFSPMKTLSPWPLVYIDQGGPSFPWITNIVLWITGVIGLPALMKSHWRIGIFSLLFTTGGVIFFLFFPVPYVQYFIPLSAVVCLSTAAFGERLVSFVSRYLPPRYEFVRWSLLVLVPGALLVSFVVQYSARLPLGGSNKEQLEAIRSVLTVVKPDEPVYDRTGEYIFRPDSYFICCHPYAEFVDHLSIRVPNLRESLVETKTKYILLDQKGYVFWHPKPDDLDFILTNYQLSRHFKLYTLGVAFRCADNTCQQYNLHLRPTGKPPTSVFSLALPETYALATTPSGLVMKIDGTSYPDGSNIPLDAGVHRFEVPSSLSAFVLQILR